MKQRKIVSMMGALVVLFLTASLMVGCPSPSDSAKEYAGSYTGTFGGTLTGTWSGTCKASGDFSGEFIDSSSTKYPATATVTSAGALNGSMDASGGSVKITFKGTIKKDGTVSGTWENTTLGVSGTFTGKKK